METKQSDNALLIYNHSLAASLVEKYLPANRAAEVQDDLKRIDNLEANETVEARREQETLPEGFDKVTTRLAIHKIDPSLLTVEEATKLSDFVANANKEVIQIKTEAISDTITKVINGVHHRRDWVGIDEQKAQRLEDLQSKRERYENGDYDTSYGFDIEFYQRDSEADRAKLGLESNHYYNDYAEYEGRDERYSSRDYARFLRDGGVRNELDYRLENWDLDELIDSGTIDERDVFVYGPYTSRDVEELEGSFKFPTWVTTPNFRDQIASSDLLSQTFIARTNTPEFDLTCAYVAKEFLPNHRANVKNLLSMTASVGLEYATKQEELSSTQPKELITEFERTLSFASFYSAKILKMTKNYLEDKFGKARPISEDFFKEVIARVEGLTKMQLEDISEEQAPYINKLNDSLFRVEALFPGDNKATADVLGLPEFMDVDEDFDFEDGSNI